MDGSVGVNGKRSVVFFRDGLCIGHISIILQPPRPCKDSSGLSQRQNCLPAHMLKRSKVDFFVPTVFAGLVVAASACVLRSLALWDNE
ncbi:UNC93-like protein 3-like [Hibiscus syriacus]|uniref:UNC93-like protein 3-like n=1 Tax=Hibiscus syriacus TaxID=106335 RepID=A0A6A2XSJ7_HIBSY|nr:UNC93-like protein 3-like [Hibiscus syriacus]